MSNIIISSKMKTGYAIEMEAGKGGDYAVHRAIKSIS